MYVVQIPILRVLKKGGMCVIFGGSITWYKLRGDIKG
ncbi:hypothetical protein FPSM_01110 [Flavobacterium psychrophilum]|nr:hypothetical protein FPSM_01110 [Flavobacterium psychrophilum]